MNSQVTLLMFIAIALMPHQREEVRVPRQAAPVIDGRLSPGEWDGSYETMLDNGGKLLIRHDGEYLYLGMRLGSSGFPSLCVAVGDTLRVLHSSAALASAVYVRNGSSWTLRQRFRNAMRSGDVSAAGKIAQRAYLTAERWLASVEAMSGTEREMQVALSLMDRNDMRLVLGVYTSSNDGAFAWPPAVADGCTAVKSVQGWLPDTLVADVTKWPRLMLSP